MYKIIDTPAALPISLQDAKDYLKVDHNLDDTIIERLIVSATEVVQHDTGRCLLSQSVRESWDCLPLDRVLTLALSPLIEVTHIKYLDTAGTLTEWDASNYTVDSDSEPPRIVLKPSASWPALGSYPNALQVTYVAGYADVDSAPKAAKQSILLQVGLLYERREDMPMGNALRSQEWLTQKLRVNVL